MLSSTLFRFSGWAGVVSGLLLLADTLLFDLLWPTQAVARIPSLLVIPSGLLALVGLYLWQRESSGRLGGIGYILNTVGLVLLFGVVFANNFILAYLDGEAVQALFAGPTRLAFLMSALIFLIGVVLFSIATVKARVLPGKAAVLYCVGFIPLGLSALLPALVVNIGQVVGALGIVWLGYALRKAA